jgi:hypothetical protein
MGRLLLRPVAFAFHSNFRRLSHASRTAAVSQQHPQPTVRCVRLMPSHKLPRAAGKGDRYHVWWHWTKSNRRKYQTAAHAWARVGLFVDPINGGFEATTLSVVVVHCIFFPLRHMIRNMPIVVKRPAFKHRHGTVHKLETAFIYSRPESITFLHTRMPRL